MQAARRNLSLAQTAATTARLKLQMSQRRINELFSILERSRAASIVAENVYRQTLQQTELSVQIGDVIQEHSFEEVFHISSITFISEFIRHSPNELEVNIRFETPYNNMSYEKRLVYRESLGNESIKLIANDISRDTFGTITKRSVTPKERVQ